MKEIYVNDTVVGYCQSVSSVPNFKHELDAGLIDEASLTNLATVLSVYKSSFSSEDELIFNKATNTDLPHAARNTIKETASFNTIIRAGTGSRLMNPDGTATPVAKQLRKWDLTTYDGQPMELFRINLCIMHLLAPCQGLLKLNYLVKYRDSVSDKKAILYVSLPINLKRGIRGDGVCNPKAKPFANIGELHNLSNTYLKDITNLPSVGRMPYHQGYEEDGTVMNTTDFGNVVLRDVDVYSSHLDKESLASYIAGALILKGCGDTAMATQRIRALDRQQLISSFGSDPEGARTIINTAVNKRNSTLNDGRRFLYLTLTGFVLSLGGGVAFSKLSKEERMAAFKVLYDASPYQHVVTMLWGIDKVCDIVAAMDQTPGVPDPGNVKHGMRQCFRGYFVDAMECFWGQICRGSIIDVDKESISRLNLYWRGGFSKYIGKENEKSWAKVTVWDFPMNALGADGLKQRANARQGKMYAKERDPAKLFLPYTEDHFKPKPPPIQPPILRSQKPLARTASQVEYLDSNPRVAATLAAQMSNYQPAQEQETQRLFRMTYPGYVFPTPNPPFGVPFGQGAMLPQAYGSGGLQYPWMFAVNPQKLPIEREHKHRP